VTIPRFHHSAVVIPRRMGDSSDSSSTSSSSSSSNQHKKGEGNEVVFVFGGLGSIGILPTVEETTTADAVGNGCIISFIDNGGDDNHNNDTALKPKLKTQLSRCGKLPDSLSVFGASVCNCSTVMIRDDDDDCSNSDDKDTYRQQLLITGGISHDDTIERSLKCITFIDNNSNVGDGNDATNGDKEARPSFISIKINSRSEDVVDFGSLVHHTALDISYRENDGTRVSEIVLLGGGVPSFSFGQSFARSYCLGFCPSDLTTNNRQSYVSTHNKQQGKAATTFLNNQLPHKPSSSKDIHNNSTTKLLHQTNVLYVRNKNAKELKVALEALNYLDKTYRMTKAVYITPVDDAHQHVAVPINQTCVSAMSRNDLTSSMPWISIIISRGRQAVPYSTSILGRRNNFN